MRTTVQPEVTIQAKKRSRQDPRLPAPRTIEPRRTTASIFAERRPQSR